MAARRDVVRVKLKEIKGRVYGIEMSEEKVGDKYYFLGWRIS
jgi:hypothetical protein